MTGKSQAEAVSVLRNASPGSIVKIVVSRQEDVLEPTLPRIIVSNINLLVIFTSFYFYLFGIFVCILIEFLHLYCIFVCINIELLYL